MATVDIGGRMVEAEVTIGGDSFAGIKELRYEESEPVAEVRGRGVYTCEATMEVTDEGRAFFAELAALSRPDLRVTWTMPRKVVHHASTKHLSGRARRLFKAIRKREAKMRRSQTRVMVLPPGTEITYETVRRAPMQPRGVMTAFLQRDAIGSALVDAVEGES